MPEIFDAFPGFTFGADPELFIYDTKAAKFICADGIIPGCKTAPHKVTAGAVQPDGFAAEFNIDPAASFAEFDFNITTVLKALKGMLPENCELRADSSVIFDKAVFDAAPERAKQLGCSSDWNAWTESVNPPPDLPENPRMRTLGGHLHIGWTQNADVSDAQHISHCNDLVRQLDWYLGAWSVALDPDVERRKLYGKAGACRYKDYGVEYRVLSSFWVLDKKSRLAVWNRMQHALQMMNKIYLPDRAPPAYNKTIKEIIDTGLQKNSYTSAMRYPLRTIDPGFNRF